MAARMLLSRTHAQRRYSDFGRKCLQRKPHLAGQPDLALMSADSSTTSDTAAGPAGGLGSKGRSYPWVVRLRSRAATSSSRTGSATSPTSSPLPPRKPLNETRLEQDPAIHRELARETTADGRTGGHRNARPAQDRAAHHTCIAHYGTCVRFVPLRVISRSAFRASLMRQPNNLSHPRLRVKRHAQCPPHLSESVL